MEGLMLFIPILVLVVFALFAFYRLSVQGEQRETSPYYNLGVPCPDGVAASPCPHCGHIFGTEVAEAARQKCEEGLRSTAKGPSDQASLVGLFQSIWWNVVCPSCGRQSSYVPQARVLLHQEEGQLSPESYWQVPIYPLL